MQGSSKHNKWIFKTKYVWSFSAVTKKTRISWVHHVSWRNYAYNVFTEINYILDDSGDESDNEEVEEKEYPPCIRAIVMESDKLSLGSLNIITCMGTTFSR